MIRQADETVCFPRRLLGTPQGGARTALGEDRFAAAWAPGRSMSREEAVAWALELRPPAGS
jgi:hypothetical protein